MEKVRKLNIWVASIFVGGIVISNAAAQPCKYTDKYRTSSCNDVPTAQRVGHRKELYDRYEHQCIASPLEIVFRGNMEKVRKLNIWVASIFVGGIVISNAGCLLLISKRHGRVQQKKRSHKNNTENETYNRKHGKDIFC
jgi:hypothetical protein